MRDAAGASLRRRERGRLGKGDHLGGEESACGEAVLVGDGEGGVDASCCMAEEARMDFGFLCGDVVCDGGEPEESINLSVGVGGFVEEGSEQVVGLVQ